MNWMLTKTRAGVIETRALLCSFILWTLIVNTGCNTAERITIFHARYPIESYETRSASMVAAVSPTSMLVVDYHPWDVEAPQRFIVWSLTGTILSEFDVPPELSWHPDAALSPDGSTLIAYRATGGYWRIDLSSGKAQEFSLQEADPDQWGVRIALCGDSVLVKACDGSEAIIKGYDLSTGKKLWQRNCGNVNFSDMAAFPDGKRCIAITETAAYVLDAGNGALLYEHKLPVLGLSVAVSPDGKQYAVAGGSHASLSACGGPHYSSDKREYAIVCIAAQPSYREQGKLQGHTASVRRLAYLSNKEIVSSSDDETVKVWDIAARRATWQAERLSLNTAPAIAVWPERWLAIQGYSSTILVRILPHEGR